MREINDCRCNDDPKCVEEEIVKLEGFETPYEEDAQQEERGNVIEQSQDLNFHRKVLRSLLFKLKYTKSCSLIKYITAQLLLRKEKKHLFMKTRCSHL